MDTIIQILGKLDAPYCLIQNDNLVWANSIFLTQFSIKKTSFNTPLTEATSFPDEVLNRIHDKRAGVVKFNSIEIDIQFVDNFAVLKAMDVRTPEEKLLDFVNGHRGILFKTGALSLKADTIKLPGGTRASITPNIAGLSRWLEMKGHENGIVIFHISEREDRGADMKDLGFVLYSGKDLAESTRVNEKRDNPGYFYRALLQKKDRKYELTQPTHTQYLDTDYWMLKDKVADTVQLYRSSKESQASSE